MLPTPCLLQSAFVALSSTSVSLPLAWAAMASSGGVRDLLAFQISSWYPAFARVTFKTVILPLPPAVTDWLVSDGLHLAPDSQAVSREMLGMDCVHAICAGRAQRTRRPPRRRRLLPLLFSAHRLPRPPAVCQARAA